MDKQPVSKLALLDTMRENRAKHLEIYAKALVKYRERAIVALTQQLGCAKEDKKFSLRFNLVIPVNYLREYDSVIGLLEMSKADVVDLTQAEYRQYVKDEWSWAESFTSNSRSYLHAAGSSNADVADSE